MIDKDNLAESDSARQSRVDDQSQKISGKEDGGNVDPSTLTESGQSTVSHQENCLSLAQLVAEVAICIWYLTWYAGRVLVAKGIRLGSPEAQSTVDSVDVNELNLENVGESKLAVNSTAINSEETESLVQLIAEVSNCLWYLKTKHFKCEWQNDDNADDDPRVRRALGRLNKSIDALRMKGVEVQDPTNKRYPPGSEGMMRPIQFQPTSGLTCEVVTEVIVPIIFRHNRLVQRGEVFVAVPQVVTGPGNDKTP